MQRGSRSMSGSTIFKCLFCKGWSALNFLPSFTNGPVVIYAWTSGCLAKSLHQTSKSTNSKIRCKYMGKMEFGLDLVEVSSFVFGCINLSGTVPDAVALAASTGVPLESSIQTSAPNREEVAGSVFHLPCGRWEFSWPACAPVIFVRVNSSWFWMQKAVAHIMPENDTVCL